MARSLLPEPGPVDPRPIGAPEARHRARVRLARRRIRQGFYHREEFQLLLVQRLLARFSQTPS